MIRKVAALAAVVGFGVILLTLVQEVETPNALSSVSDQYVSEVPGSLGAANIVTGIVVTYRGFDTLGEVSVLFLAAAGVGFVLSTGRDHSPEEHKPPRPPSEILETGAALLSPLLLLFGTYIFAHGHLTPGGGFQGGVVLASALVLSVLSSAHPRLSHGVLTVVESLSGAFYVTTGLAGLVFAGGFLDTTFLGRGTLGTLLSAGAIPVIYSLIGLKVGTELTGIVERLREH